MPANPNALVSTDWVAEHGRDANVRVLESNEDVLLYDVGHVPGAQKIDWQADLNDPVTRDFIGPEAFAALAVGARFRSKLVEKLVYNRRCILAARETQDG